MTSSVKPALYLHHVKGSTNKSLESKDIKYISLVGQVLGQDGHKNDINRTKSMRNGIMITHIVSLLRIIFIATSSGSPFADLTFFARTTVEKTPFP